MESRVYFVKQVVSSIKENHGQHGDSFIFGISGKWGEGKTHFLEQLEEELKRVDSSFQIYKINPWKFSNDKVSFLRNFLKTLYPEGKQKKLEFLYTDTSETKIHWGLFWLFLVLLVLAFVGYTTFKTKLFPSLPENLRSFLTNGKLFWSLILLPIFLSFGSKIFTIQKSNHGISTVDKFDSLLVEVLRDLECNGVKPVIFVDDLDRVTPEMARSVLDNLRTFFDKKDITFVVAGDHTVLERFLGRDLLPDASEPDQLEEGRRFMKKIFNVYWRLPLPIQQELDRFLEKEFQKREAVLSGIFPNEVDRKILQGYLGLYFEKNFRQIIRFFEVVLFTFQIIRQKSESESETERKYFLELTQNPLLVVRILMIQELCAPLFERILGNYQILSDLEYAVEKKDNEKINSLLSPYSEELSSLQEKFIKRFLYEEPRFYKASSLVVSDIQPFLFLAADASFGDSRGPSKEDFMSIVSAGDPDQVKNSLLSISDQKAQEAVQIFIIQFAALAPNDTYKTSYISTISIALQKLPSEYTVHRIFGEALKSLDYSFINTYPDSQKLDLLKTLWGWIDLLGEDLRTAYLEKFPYTNVIDFSWLDLPKAGPFSVKIVTRWLRTYYQQNKEDAINRMIDVLPKINLAEQDNIKEEMQKMQEVLLIDIINDASEYRNKRLSLIKEYTFDGVNILRKRILEKILELNGDIFQWSKSKIDDGLWKLKDLEEKVLEKLAQSADYSSLNQVLAFITSNSVSDADHMWAKLTSQQVDMLIEDLPSVMGNPYPYTPNSKKGLQILNKALEKIKKIEDENQKAQWLDYIRKDKWLWTNVNSFPKKKIEEFSKSSNETLKNKYQEIISTWGIK